ncbi:VHS-domain-containing protein [Neoconidiobolus thromboides FSU 785]|nr:VHS-domain-containing protein [Neoconidiobolus thromboides FSU 785]
MVERACDIRLMEPDMALNLDIAEYINKKKQNIPHDVSEYLVQLINNRDQKVAMLALILLDTCIRNCGYAFHLQIARKEFLNELVKKFPEVPPPFPTSVQIKILEFINEWKLGLCSQPRYKQDFRKISELHNILIFKGYKFPNVKQDRVSTLVTKQAFCSAEELEEADKEALSAKLQEHIRRGTPADLVKANELMKLLSGYEIEKRPNYQSLVERQLLNVQRSIETLSERLIPGMEFDRGIQELYNECSSAQVRIQKLILEEEEGEHANRLFELNDKLNELNQQYENAKKGIFDHNPIYFEDHISMERSEITNDNSNNSNNNNNSNSQKEAESQQISLIDLGDDFMNNSSNTLDPLQYQSNKTETSISSTLNFMDSLEGLSFGSIASSNSITPAPSTPQPVLLQSNNTSPKLSDNEESPMNNSNNSNLNNFNTNLLEDNGLIGNESNEGMSNGEVKQKKVLENEFVRIMTTSFVQENIVFIQFNFNNLSNFKMEQLDFKLAVPKGLKTVISGISGTYLLPKIGHVSLPVEIYFNNNLNEVKYRYILSFQLNSKQYTFQGEVKNF